MRRSRSTLARVFAVSIPIALLATGCGSGGGDSAGASAEGTCEGTSVNVGVVTSASDAPMFIADSKGYFKEEGLDVNFQSFDSAAKMIAPLGSGDLDVGGGAPSAGFYNAVARDVSLKIVADKGTMNEEHTYMPMMVRTDLVEDGKVAGLEDLKGLAVAEPAQATATASSLSSMLESAGLGYDDVEHSYLGFGEHLAAFANGGIDASLTTEPNATLMEEEGVAVRFASPSESYGSQQLAVILYSAAFAENTAVGNCFMKGYLRGVRDYVSAFEEGRLDSGKADAVVDIVTEATGIKPDLYRKIVPNYIDPDGKLDQASLQKDYDFFIDQGAIEGEPIELSSIIDTSFAETAAAELGKFTG
ncbi:ABC transporter substrate-binding protein [Arthrobacter crystallopoietes]|uniref:ABC transporter substrate-binding protein n=1 Tax=Crystallibacter crystallopoietes TaxID=37928 RepID=UPI0011114BA2|nr:ABC transporter substrate-binding protein [Arthrobacter crystallopoietes]